MLRRLCLTLALLLSMLALAAPAEAEVLVTFWSHDRDQNYPHAFITMQGRVDATGEVVDTNMGFTANSISPMLLIGSVGGHLERLSAGYLARPTTRPHFALRLNDAQFARLRAAIAQWQSYRQPSYNLNRRN